MNRRALTAAFIMLALTGSLAGCAGLRAGRPAGDLAPRPPGISEREERNALYLDLAYRQLQQFERESPDLDPERLGAGALTAAALATAGRETVETAGNAARYVAAGLDQCTGQWGKVACERMLLALQRVVLQYPGALPPALLARLRSEAASTVRPPEDEEVRDPWSFHDTENQRLVRMARCLAAAAIDPGQRTESAAWGEATAAFLRAHDRTGWYEAESPGYTATSVTALLQIADHAPQPAVRLLARRELDLLFADWAQRHVDGFPAGPKSRSYVHWALGSRNTPWVAWAWLAAGLGDSREIWLMDWPEIATSGYAVPESVVELLAARRRQPPYEIRARRSITLPGRRRLDTALYTFATPDYVLGAAQSVEGLRLGVSGGQEIMATLYAAGSEFAPLYLWSRTQNLRADRWRSWAEQDFAVGSRNLLVARLAEGGGSSAGGGTAERGAIGHAYLSPPWSAPERVGDDVIVTRYRGTYVALVTAGGWDIEPASRRFPAYYGGDPAFEDAWVAVPRVQPAVVALEAGRRSQAGGFPRWKRRAAAACLTVAGGELRFTASDGTRINFLPGVSATVDGRPLAVSEYPLLAGPFLSSPETGRWMFSFGHQEVRFNPLDP